MFTYIYISSHTRYHCNFIVMGGLNLSKTLLSVHMVIQTLVLEKIWNHI